MCVLFLNESILSLVIWANSLNHFDFFLLEILSKRHEYITYLSRYLREEGLCQTRCALQVTFGEPSSKDNSLLVAPRSRTKGRFIINHLHFQAPYLCR